MTVVLTLHYSSDKVSFDPSNTMKTLIKDQKELLMRHISQQYGLPLPKDIGIVGCDCCSSIALCY